ncbi:SdrD B-like domain-containing protein [Kineobactrum salinum]|uniref:DUF11 domain-containing protein n=1 Tax=Kineobactrum salinum TaxID=2708301 RepID=A0A6C0U760_9GAMM|nr:SdrD B-like domain-containing protein [Kineobactrum salinum]QIB66265.1 DUF11 domain-containing protein [Kineobactrum salinum]
MTCTRVSLNAGDTWVIGSIGGAVAVSGPSSLSTTASTSSDVFDGISANNTAAVDTTVNEGTDVSVSMTRTGPGTLVQLDEFVINLNPRYTGGQPQNLTMTANLDPAFQIQNGSPFSQNGWDCTVAGQTVNCTRADGGGDVGGEFDHNIGQVSIDVRAIAFGNNLGNTATVSSVSPDDAQLANNSDNLNITVQEPDFDLQALKSGPTQTLRVVNGESFSFNLRVRNNSNVAFVGELTMTDSLPAGLRVDSYSLNGWSCGPATPVNGADTISCTRTYTEGSPLAAGATTPSVLLDTVATATGSHSNQMCVTNTPAPGYVFPADSDGANDCDNSAVEGQLNADSADIQVYKSGSATVVAGELLSYQLEIVNAGPEPAQSVTLTDTFGSLFTGGPGNGFEGAVVVAGNATLGSCSNAAAANVTSRNLSCTFSDMPVCSQGVDCPVITVQVRPLGSASNGTDLNRNNTASAFSSVTSDPVYGNNSDNHATTVTGQADIAAIKTASWAEDPDPIAAGTNLSYTITVRNESTGASGASTVSMSDTLPLDVTFISASASDGGSCGVTPAVGATTEAGDRTVECTWASVQRGGQRTVSLVVRPNRGTQASTLSNTVTSATSTPEVTLDNNDADVDVPVAAPEVDLATTQVDSPDPLQIDETVVYTLTVRNLGPSVAETVRLYNVLPTSGLSFLGFQYVDGGGITQPGLPPGVSCPVQPAVGEFGKTVDRVDTALLTPSDPAWLNGAWDPELDNADIICDVSALMLAGDDISFQMLLDAEASGVYTNYMIARSQEHRDGFDDVNPANDLEPENTTVRTRADMEVASKTADPGSVSLFEPFEYSIVVQNNGPHEALGVELEDSFPAGMELLGAPAVVVDQGSFETTSCSGVAGDTAVTCDFGEISADGRATVTLPVRLISAAGAAVNNTATVNVTGLTLDDTPGNNSNDGSVTVVRSSIAGRVYHDQDISGDYDVGEPGISGVTVTLTGSDDYGNTVNRSTTTDGTGEYRFEDLAPGVYTLTESHPAAWVDGQETVGSVGGTTPTTDVITNIELAAGVDATDYNYGEFQVGSVASISGYVYHDQNEDGIFDGDENPIAGVVVDLAGPVPGSTTTDANGFYSFTGLAPGSYTVTEQQPTDWLDGLDTAGTVAALVSEVDDEFVVELLAGDEAQQWNFGEIALPDAPAPVPALNRTALALLSALLLLLSAGHLRRRGLL